jgi:thiol-disulfide isomerase/thioredoxin
MKTLLALPLCLLTAVLSAAPVWLTDLDAAKAQGVKENKPVLIDFTGSDWCPPCKQMHKVVFESAEFTAFASKYVLVELDFPRTKTQTPELKAKNREWQQKYAVNSFPTVLLLDAKSGDVFGRVGGFGGQTAKEYLAKLAAYKNTPEGKAELAKEMKDTADRSAKSRVLGQKINEAMAAKDFKAAEAALEEMFADVTGPRRAVLPFNKARILIMLDPAAKEKALKHVDEAIAAAQGDEAMTRSFKAFRDKLMSADAAAPKPAGEPKKGA